MCSKASFVVEKKEPTMRKITFSCFVKPNVVGLDFQLNFKELITYSVRNSLQGLTYVLSQSSLRSFYGDDYGNAAALKSSRALATSP